MPSFDKKFVAIGRVIQGLRVFKYIDKFQLNQERPVDEIKIIKCGTEGWWDERLKTPDTRTKNFGQGFINISGFLRDHYTIEQINES